ncbi:Putative deoxyribonuclease RhsC [Metakosakonia massiliensis]|uniref:Deoxyribonuclease RhsC n=1 Tax=Phytobacter massiliensis TaxID=1485952 RepID=A0A6N3H6P4_9ENTR
MAQTRDGDRDWQTFIYEPGTHRPLAVVDGHRRSHPYGHKPAVYWYQLDHLGTPQSLTDVNGRQLYTCEYDAYGQVSDEWFLRDYDTNERLLSFRNPLRFQGQYEDEESGLFYNLNRYYDPTLGRYITQDPIKLVGGSNFYQYCPNPVSWIDPLGLKGLPGQKTDSPAGDRAPEPATAANGSFNWENYNDIPELPDAAPGEYNYRGVHRGHPDADNNIKGQVNPRDVNSEISPEEHNLGGLSANSPFTSWTDDPMIARRFAGEDGIILRVKTGAPQADDTWSWTFSFDEYLEREILLKGPRGGDVEVFKP